MRRRNPLETPLWVPLSIVLIVLIAAVFVFAYRGSVRDVTFAVDSKERVCDSGSDGQQECRYLVFTDAGTYQVTDTILFGRFDSSDVYGRLDEGETYQGRVAGWRVPFLSRYPNLIEVGRG